MLLDRWPDADPTGRDLITAVRRSARRLQTQLDEAVEGLGLSYAQYEVMEHLAVRPNLHAGELARRLRITRQTAHGLVQQLARADLVDVLPPDFGARPMRLTSLGRRRLHHCRHAIASIEALLEEAEPNDRGTFLVLLAGLDARVAPTRTRPWWLG